jgi:GDP-4-dehydro-6-deoxy-D-mannose reductase
VPAAADDPGRDGRGQRRRRARACSASCASGGAPGTLDPVGRDRRQRRAVRRHDAAELPLRETAEQRPHTVYAATKVAQEAFALEAFRSDGVRVVARGASTTAGRAGDRFLLPALVAARSRCARAGADARGQPEHRARLPACGRRRARLYCTGRARRAGEAYNVASGEGHSVGDLRAACWRASGVDAPVESDPALVRPADVPALVGDATKLRTATGWRRERHARRHSG